MSRSLASPSSAGGGDTCTCSRQAHLGKNRTCLGLQAISIGLKKYGAGRGHNTRQANPHVGNEVQSNRRRYATSPKNVLAVTATILAHIRMASRNTSLLFGLDAHQCFDLTPFLKFHDPSPEIKAETPPDLRNSARHGDTGI